MANTNMTNPEAMDNRSMQITREQEIAAVIGARYSINDQLAILRQRDTKPDEFKEFNDFAESVKANVTASRIAKDNASGNE